MFGILTEIPSLGTVSGSLPPPIVRRGTRGCHGARETIVHCGAGSEGGRVRRYNVGRGRERDEIEEVVPPSLYSLITFYTVPTNPRSQVVYDCKFFYVEESSEEDASQAAVVVVVVVLHRQVHAVRSHRVYLLALSLERQCVCVCTAAVQTVYHLAV
jgi:hypothetical protein